MAIKIKVLMCGGRNFHGPDLIREELGKLLLQYAPTEVLVIHGDAQGADRNAGYWAEEMGIHVARVPALWPVYHKPAGPMRNRVMLDLEPDLVIAFHDKIDESKGTKDCLQEAKRRGIPTILVTHAKTE